MRVVLLALFWTASLAWSQTRDVVALARSEAPFLASGAEAPGESNIFEGESLTSYYLPAWIDYLDGSRYVLGIGSAARLWTSRIELEGVSLEVVSPGPGRRPIAAGRWTFLPSSDCRATIYLDHADTVTVHVAQGSMEVVSRTGEAVDGAQSGEAKTYAFVQEELRVQENRGPLEMARILLRELNYAYLLSEAVPPFEKKRAELANRLVESTSGVLMLDADVRGLELISGGNAEALAIDPQLVKSVAQEVSYEIHHSVGWDRYGCGKPVCVDATGIISGRPFGGDARLVAPQLSGCLLCLVEKSNGR